MRQLSDIILNQKPLLMLPSTVVRDACEQMAEYRHGCVLVVDEFEKLAGIFTGRDVVHRVVAANRDVLKTPLSKVMTANPVTMSPECNAIEALRLMWDGGFRHVPVVKGPEILGVVSRGDFRGSEVLRLEDERELWEHMR